MGRKFQGEVIGATNWQVRSSTRDSWRTMWEFKCICGRYFLAPHYRVLGKRVDNASCGCFVKINHLRRKNWTNLAGTRQGDLQVIKEDSVNSFGRIMWTCYCHACGNDAKVNTKTVQKGHCGCLTSRRMVIAQLNKYKEKINALNRSCEP